MPVDAYIFATANEAVAEPIIRTLAVDLMEALGANRLWDNGAGVLCQVARADYDLLPDDLPRSPCVLQVRPSTPYYGPGYERGQWHEIAAVLEFLRRRLPDAQVWYGPDSGDWVQEVTAESMDALWKHWAEHGGRPYYERQSSA